MHGDEQQGKEGGRKDEQTQQREASHPGDEQLSS